MGSIPIISTKRTDRIVVCLLTFFDMTREGESRKSMMLAASEGDAGVMRWSVAKPFGFAQVKCEAFHWRPNLRVRTQGETLKSVVEWRWLR